MLLNGGQVRIMIAAQHICFRIQTRTKTNYLSIDKKINLYGKCRFKL